MSRMGGVVMFWDDEQAKPRLGDGISRPTPKARTKMFRVRVKQPGNPVMVALLPAETKRRAEMYASARWPDATVEAIS